MFFKRIKKIFQNLVVKEKSPNVLAFSFCVGVYVAFCPYVGLHTVIIFLTSWLFSLNLAASFSAAWLINNPWTMFGIYTADYMAGDLFLKKLLGICPLAINPAWMAPVNNFIAKHTGISGISIWSFFIGGNLLGLLLSVMLYPVVKLIFKRLSKNANTVDCNKECQVNENNH